VSATERRAKVRPIWHVHGRAYILGRGDEHPRGGARRHPPVYSVSGDVGAHVGPGRDVARLRVTRLENLQERARTRVPKAKCEEVKSMLLTPRKHESSFLPRTHWLSAAAGTQHDQKNGPPHLGQCTKVGLHKPRGVPTSLPSEIVRADLCPERSGLRPIAVTRHRNTLGRRQHNVMYARFGMNRPLSRSARPWMYQSSEAAQSQEALGHEAEEQEPCSSPTVLSSFPSLQIPKIKMPAKKMRGDH
jgi:hypothetical protein